MASAINIASYLNQDYLSDVTLLFGERKVKCHRIILANASEYFKNTFKPALRATGVLQVIELKDDPIKAVDAMIRHIYSFDYAVGDEAFSVEEHLEVYKVALKYEVSALEKRALDKLFRLPYDGIPRDKQADYRTKAEWLLPFVKIFDTHQTWSDRFKTEMLRLIKQYLGELMVLEEFRSLPLVKSEEVVKLIIEAIQRDVQRDGYNRVSRYY